MSWLPQQGENGLYYYNDETGAFDFSGNNPGLWDFPGYSDVQRYSLPDGGDSRTFLNNATGQRENAVVDPNNPAWLVPSGMAPGASNFNFSPDQKDPAWVDLAGYGLMAGVGAAGIGGLGGLGAVGGEFGDAALAAQYANEISGGVSGALGMDAGLAAGYANEISGGAGGLSQFGDPALATSYANEISGGVSAPNVGDPSLASSYANEISSPAPVAPSAPGPGMEPPGGLEQASQATPGDLTPDMPGDIAHPANFEIPQAPGPLSKLGDTISDASDWIEKHPTMSRLGIGAGIGALQMYGASQAAKKQADLTKQAQQNSAAQRAQTNSPPPYTSMNVQPAVQSDVSRNAPLSLQALMRYGQGPEYRYFNARGGLPTSGPMRSAFDQMRAVSGDGGGQDDNVPAMLSPSEFIMDADVVSALGDGNPDEGAKKLDRMRHQVRQHKRSASKTSIPPKARRLNQYLPDLKRHGVTV